MVTATGNIAGASVNPARTFGLFVMDFLLGGSNLWEFCPTYVIGPVIVAGCAAVFNNRIPRNEEGPIPFQNPQSI
jgi:glycerol uptake facilitator protein